jgi:hypothetical protein
LKNLINGGLFIASALFLPACSTTRVRGLPPPPTIYVQPVPSEELVASPPKAFGNYPVSTASVVVTESQYKNGKLQEREVVSKSEYKKGELIKHESIERKKVSESNKIQ